MRPAELLAGRQKRPPPTISAPALRSRYPKNTENQRVILPGWRVTTTETKRNFPDCRGFTSRASTPSANWRDAPGGIGGNRRSTEKARRPIESTSHLLRSTCPPFLTTRCAVPYSRNL